MLKFARQHKLPLILGLVAALSIAGSIVLGFMASKADPVASPKRAVEAPASPAPLPIPVATTEAEPVEGPSLDIASSNILRLAAPAIDLDLAVSGETWPRQTENCKGGSIYCIDPPVPDQAAWYGDPPSYPSVNPVLLFGHTSWNNPMYAAFNNLLAIQAGDLITVTTETGVFTYKAMAPELVPYSEVAESDLIYGWVPEKLVLVTCNNAEHSATVIVANLVDAEPL